MIFLTQVGAPIKIIQCDRRSAWSKVLRIASTGFGSGSGVWFTDILRFQVIEIVLSSLENIPIFSFRCQVKTFTRSRCSDTMKGMGKAGKSLRQVLETYGISQNRLAVTMGVNRATVNQWFNETRDPLAESIPDIVNALEQLNEVAAKEFVALYLGRIAQDDPPE